MANRKVTKDESDAQIAAAVLASFPLNKLDRILGAHSTDHDKIVVKGSNLIPLRIGDNWFLIDTDTNVSTASDLDTGSIDNGKDYYVYACDDSGTLVFKLSLASTYPSGFTANNSRKIGGFHTLCVNAGTISGHTLTGYVANDILPESIWDLKHRTTNGVNVGMAYSKAIHKWIDIYLVSGTGANTTSVYGATISDIRNWMDFVDDGAAVYKRLLTDAEFQVIAAGSNEETNISGGADPNTTGGHSDSASRRMISNIGCEDCCGAMWQWLQDQSYRLDDLTAIVAATKTTTVTDDDTPGGNIIYLKFDNGEPYLCCNMASAAADKIVTFGTDYKVTIKHDASASGGLAVTFDDDGTQPSRLIVNNTILSKDCYIPTNHPMYYLKLKHGASGGVNLYYDDGANNRLECACANNANADIDLAEIGNTPWAYYDLAGDKGSLYRQGDYGDVKLLAGGLWAHSTACGARSRDAYHYRWNAVSAIGARCLAEPL